MRSKVLAVVLIVLGVGATLGGLYGQIFLAEDEGHHDDREPTFALESQVGADELTASTPGPNGVAVEVTRAGQPLELDTIHGASGHVFVLSPEDVYFEHRVVDQVSTGTAELVVLEDVPPGEVGVVTQLSPGGGPDLLELGTTVNVEGRPVAGQNVTDTDVWSDGALTVTRQGFDFVLSEPWNGADVYDGPAFLTLFRVEDLAFTHAHAEVVGDDRFSFATDLPGLGDYLAALEFEQNGVLVTALFRFTL